MVFRRYKKGSSKQDEEIKKNVFYWFKDNKKGKNLQLEMREIFLLVNSLYKKNILNFYMQREKIEDKTVLNICTSIKITKLQMGICSIREVPIIFEKDVIYTCCTEELIYNLKIIDEDVNRFIEFIPTGIIELTNNKKICKKK